MMGGTLPTVIIRAIASLVVLFVLATTFLALRIWARSTLSRTWRPAVDDTCLIMAWIFFTVQLCLRTVILSASTFAEIYTVPRYSLLGKIAGIFSNMAWALSKTSFSVTLMGFITGRTRWILWFVIASMNIFIAVWLPLFLNPCVSGVSTHYWQLDISVNLGIFVGAYSAFNDFLLSLLPWKVIWPLHLSKREKVGVCVAMSMGIMCVFIPLHHDPAGAMGIIKVIYLFKFDSLSIYTVSGLYIWESAEIAATIMATSIPMMRKFIVRAASRRNLRENDQDMSLSTFRRQLQIAGLFSKRSHTTSARTA